MVAGGTGDTGAARLKILFVTSTRIGDAVLSTGLLDDLLRRYPEALITIACGPVAAGVFERMPRRERTILIVKQTFDRHWLALWREVVTTVWDLVVDLRGSALAFVVPARRRAVMRGGRREGHRLAHIGGVLGLSPPPLPVAWFSPEDAAPAAALLGEGPVIGLGPTANWTGKIWPPARFVALFEALAERLPGARAAIFGGPGEAERALAAPVLAGLPDAADLVGKLELWQAAACLARCALFVGNDSGLMHLAAATGAPTLGLFGPTSAAQYAPQGRRAAYVAAEGEAGNAAMSALAVSAVLQQAQGLLDAG